MKTRMLLALPFVGLVACSQVPKPEVDGGGPGSGCLTDLDCPDPLHPLPLLFMCNKLTARCEPGCINTEDCTAERRGEHAIEACRTDLGGLGCECDEGRCVTALCSADADCGSRVCRNGVCVAPPEPSTVSRCAITPDLAVVKKGAAVKFWLSAWSAAGAPVVPHEGAQWAAATGGPLKGSGQGLWVELTAQDETPLTGEAVLAVEAVVGGARCQAKAVVLPATVPPDALFVVVLDELSRRPLPGIDVVLSKEDGELLPSASVKTDGRGLATLPLPVALDRYSVTAFGPDHTYVTIANYGGASRYLSIVTRRNQTDRYGGSRGGYTGAPQSGNVHLGMAGMSLGGSMASLSIAQLLGPSVKRDLTIGSLTQRDVLIPSGVTLAVSGSAVKDTYSAQGLAGTCADVTGASDEAAIAAGSCGTRAAWSFVGDVPQNLLPFDTLLGGGDLSAIDVTQLLSRVGPIVSTLTSSVVRDVSFTLRPTARADGGAPDFSDEAHFTQVDHPFVQVPLGFSFVLKAPDLPKYRGAYVDSVLVVGGAKVPGRGLVPLGLGAGVNDDGSPQIDRQGALASGLIPVRMAPTHHGLEGTEYVLLVAALGGTKSGDSSATPGAAFIVAPTPDNRLAFDPDGRSPIDLTSAPFPPFPEGARFNFLDTPVAQIPARSFRFVAPGPALGAVSVVRVSFADAFDRRWEVLMDPTRGDSGFTLPKPPPAHADRLYLLNASAGPRASMMVHTQAFRAADGVGTLGFADMVELADDSGDRLTDSLRSFAFLDYNRPTVEFTVPLGQAASVAKGSTLTLKVLRFKLGEAGDADGLVRLTFAPDAGCPTAILSHEKTAGNGMLDYQLPPTCVGTDLMVTAELVATDQLTAVAPPVSAQLRLSVE